MNKGLFKQLAKSLKQAKVLKAAQAAQVLPRIELREARIKGRVYRTVYQINKDGEKLIATIHKQDNGAPDKWSVNRLTGSVEYFPLLKVARDNALKG